MRDLFENAFTAIAVFDRQMCYLAHSARWLVDYRIADTAILGRSYYEVFPDLPQRWREIHQRGLRGEILSASEDAFPRQDGTVDWVRWKVAPWHDGAGAIGGIIIFSQVVTAQVEANRFREELIANVSHELRSPLTSIIGSLALLDQSLGTALPDQTRSLLHIARKNAGRLGRLVEDLLDKGRVGAESLDYFVQDIDLGWVIADAVELNRPYAAKFGVTLEFERPTRRIVAAVDPDRVLQVLGNLVTNAIKFSHHGDVVRIELVIRDGHVRVSVIDNGCGMSPRFQKQLFKRFMREEEMSSRMPGSGLGLAITKGIIDRLGGTIEILSKQGEGTTVHVELPRSGEAGAGSPVLEG